MKIKRREFLKRSALGVGAVMLGTNVVPASESKPVFCDPYERVPLGRTGLKVSRLCQGTGMRGGNRQSDQTRMGKEKFYALLRGGYERGIRDFDMADLYGTHPYLLPALKGVPRDSFNIFTKIWFRPGGIPDRDRPDADVVIARFLREIGTDYLDLVLLHCVESPDWPEHLRKQMDIMEKLKQKGVIRAHGVSCHSIGALEAAANEAWVDSVHARINPYGMSMDGQPDKVAPVLRKIHHAGKGVVGMKLIGEGRLRHNAERRDASARYVVDLGCVDVFNVGFEKVSEIDDFAARLRKVTIKRA